MSNLFKANNHLHRGQQPLRHPSAQSHPYVPPQLPGPLYVRHDDGPRDPDTVRLPDYLRIINCPVKNDVARTEQHVTTSDIISIDTLKDWAYLERGWVPAKPNIASAGGLRRLIWERQLPNPAIHFDESVKRIPLLEHCPEAREFFIRTARAQHEPREGNCSHRCPLCQSQLLGFPMADHTLGNCPFAPLTLEDRVTFMATNNISYCPKCNARSPYHTTCSDRLKHCSACKSTGHNITLALCHHRIGEPDDEGQDYREAVVRESREDFFIRVRQNLQQALPEDRLMYKLHADHSHDQAYRRLAKGKPIIGWGPPRDTLNRYRELPNSKYSNSNIGEPPYYKALTPVEFTSDHVLKIIDIDTESYEFLNVAAETVEAIKNGHDPLTLNLNRLYELSANHVRLSQEFLANQATDATTRAAQPSNPANSTTSMPVDWTKPQAPVDSWAKYEEEYSQRQNRAHGQPTTSSQRSESYDGSSSNKSFGTMPSTSQPGPTHTLKDKEARRGNQTLPVRNSAQTPVHKTVTTVPYKQAPRAGAGQPNSSQASSGEIREHTTEHSLSKRVLTTCRHTLPVADKPSRVLFSKETYDSISRQPIPNTKPALVTRIRTMQLLITGGFETTDLARYDFSDLQEYVKKLMLIANMLYEDPLHIVQLEGSSIEAATLKLTKGADVFKIPTFSLAAHPDFRVALRDALVRQASQTHGPLQLFGPPLRRSWLEPILPRTVATGIKAFEMTNTEKEMMDKLRPEEYFLTSVYQHPKQLLRDLITLRPPMGVISAMRMRIQYTLKLLTGKHTHPLPSTSEADLARLTEYNHVLVGAVQCVNRLRTQNLTIKVSPTKCIHELVTIASGLHDMPLPDWTLFQSHPTAQWFAWLETVWTSRVRAASDAPCECQTHEFFR